MTRRLALMLALAAASACGHDEAGIEVPDTCTWTGVPSDRYLPYRVGNQWRYVVFSNDTGEQLTKLQTLTDELTPLGEVEPVIVQHTENVGDQVTETWVRVDGDRVIRVREIDYDVATQAFKKAEQFEPGKLRLDESPERTVAGATWTERYDRTWLDEQGLATLTDQFEQRWTVLSVGAPCPAPHDALSCLHLYVGRWTGNPDLDVGIGKQYWFARGFGKVREQSGPRVELLTDCSLLGDP